MAESVGIVLEGGAMRCLFTVGVMDVLTEAGIVPQGIIGVSAGAAFGCNYKSRQPGRAIAYNKRFARDARYGGVRSFLTTGDYYNAAFAYHIVPTKYDPFDDAAFERNPTAFYVVCTDIVTGTPVYKRCDTAGHPFYEWVRASASMPVLARPVRIDGHVLLDGGITDSIPLRYFESIGYEKNIVILTQPKGYVMRPNKAMPIIKFWLRRYPAGSRAMQRRHEMYNAQTAYVEEEERAGRCLVMRPESALPIGLVSHDAEAMQRVYDIGRDYAARRLEETRAFVAPSAAPR